MKNTIDAQLADVLENLATAHAASTEILALRKHLRTFKFDAEAPRTYQLRILGEPDLPGVDAVISISGEDMKQYIFAKEQQEIERLRKAIAATTQSWIILKRSLYASEK